MMHVILNYSKMHYIVSNLGCKTTCRGNLCDESGNCTNGCKDGYWGPACDIQCPANCKNCDSKTGHCISCKSGYWEDTCNSPDIYIYYVIVLQISYLVFTGEKLKDSNLKILSILYGVIAALSISLIVNGYTIIWYV